MGQDRNAVCHDCKVWSYLGYGSSRYLEDNKSSKEFFAVHQKHSTQIFSTDYLIWKNKELWTEDYGYVEPELFLDLSDFTEIHLNACECISCEKKIKGR